MMTSLLENVNQMSICFLFVWHSTQSFWLGWGPSINDVSNWEGGEGSKIDQNCRQILPQNFGYGGRAHSLYSQRRYQLVAIELVHLLLTTALFAPLTTRFGLAGQCTKALASLRTYCSIPYTGGKGVSKFQKNCRRHLWMVSCVIRIGQAVEDVTRKNNEYKEGLSPACTSI